MLLPLRATIWNIFLALIPVVMAAVITAAARAHKALGRTLPWYVWLPLGIVWFAFLPNACYLVTEWRHLIFDDLPTLRHIVPYGRDLLVSVGRDGFYYLVYSLIGAFCFMLSIRPIERLVRSAGLSPLLLSVPFFFLVSLGVYLGLIVRLNSWDIVSRPLYVAQVAVQTVCDPTLLKAIVYFAALLFMLYEVLDIFMDGLLLRVRKWRSHPQASSDARFTSVT